MEKYLSLKVTIPPRPGTAPNDNGWTYHHYLPWRYYWLSAYIVICVAKLKYLMNNPKLVPDRTEFEVGCNFEIKHQVSDFISIVNGMQRGQEDRRLNVYTLNPKINDVACDCVSPKFGGFLGMDGSQRVDDPKDKKERLWPRSGGKFNKQCLDIIDGVLKRSCLSIVDSASGSSIDVKILDNDMNLLADNLIELVNKYNRVHYFNVSDWGGVIQNVKHRWVLSDENYGGSKSAAVFFLADENEEKVGLVVSDLYRFVKTSTHSGTERIFFYRKDGNRMNIVTDGSYMESNIFSRRYCEEWLQILIEEKRIMLSNFIK